MFKKLGVGMLLIVLLITGCKSTTEDAYNGNQSVTEVVPTATEEPVVKPEVVEEEKPQRDMPQLEKPLEDTVLGKYGQLQVIGANLCDEAGNPIQLTGISTHGLQFFGSLYNMDTLGTVTDEWGAQVIRVAVYADEGGYVKNPATMLRSLRIVVDSCIKLGVYVIIDWHVLFEKTPMKYIEKSKEFFTLISNEYKDYDNVLYEICNEPNGPTTWDEDIKPYAETIIPIIRENAPNSVIIVGTPEWSRRVDQAALNPLTAENIMYTFHFYAGSHFDLEKSYLQKGIDAKLPIFVTEWGTTQASGTGGIYPEESDAWLSILDENKISWCNWSLADKAEASCLLGFKASREGHWPDDKLSDSGRYIKSKLLKNLED